MTERIIPLTAQTLQSLPSSLSLKPTSSLWPASSSTTRTHSAALPNSLRAPWPPHLSSNKPVTICPRALSIALPLAWNTHTQIAAWPSSHFLQIFIPKPPSREHLPCLPCLNLQNSPQHFQAPCRLHVSLEFFASVL